MMKKIHAIIFALIIVGKTWATGYDIKTSSVIDQPSIEVLGELKGSFYVIGFEKPGNLNKPPQFKLYKYSQGFKGGKISTLFNSFGEKTLYLQGGFVGNKISMFYAKCGKREDISILLDKRDGRRQLPVIVRQDFDPVTLESIGEAQTIFNEEDEYFAPSDMEISQSPDRSKTAILFKPYYKQQRYKVMITDNNTGDVFSKTFDFKLSKEYLKFVTMAINNNGKMIIEARVREDVITLAQSTATKGQVKYYLFSVGKGSDDKPKSFEMLAQPGKFFRDPLVTALNSGEMVVAYDYYNSDKDNSPKGTTVLKFDEELNAAGSREVTPDGKFAAQAAAYSAGKKGKEFANLRVQQILPLAGKSFLLVTEYCDSLASADKTKPASVVRNYLLTYRMDDNMGVTAQHFIPKKQVSPTVGYAFSARAFAKGNDAYLFYNGDWEADEEHNMNLQCSRLAADGSDPQTQKVLNTSNDFFTSMENVYPCTDGRVLFGVEHAVDYGDISREVKLLEITPR